jgi:aminoglycoside phosphotransferase
MTMPDRKQLHNLVDQLPESEVAAAARFLEFLNAHEAPIDAEMLARIDEARAHPSAGIPHEDILKEFGL